MPPGDEWEKWLTESRGKLLFEANMQPGDVLYLPRGQYHDALTGDRCLAARDLRRRARHQTRSLRLLESALAKESEFRRTCRTPAWKRSSRSGSPASRSASAP